MGSGVPHGPNLLLGPQFSKDVLVNIYSAYIDNFLNAKDAVRVAKEARPAFLKFLEVLWAVAGTWGHPYLGPVLGVPCGSHPSLWVSLCCQAEPTGPAEGSS